jgi:arginase
VRRIAVLDAPSNLGLRPPTVTSVPGCAKAPGALRDHGLLTQLGARDAGCLTPPRYDPGEWRPGDGVAHAAQIAAYSRALADRIGAILDAGEFPVVLGGDCSILLGSGLAMNRLGEAVGGRIGLVFVDGHSDFRHPGNASYVGAAAGEDLALVTGRGQADLAAIEGRRPYFRDIDVVVLGIRAQDEYRLDLQAAGIVTRPVPALRAEGAARSAQWARDQLVDCAGYWLHVDVDVLDPAVMPAVDAPSPGGIAFPELELLLAGLVESPHCLGVEITVFDPDYDPDGDYAAEITSAVATGLSAARTVVPRPDLAAARADLAGPATTPAIRPTAPAPPPRTPEPSVAPAAKTPAPAAAPAARTPESSETAAARTPEPPAAPAARTPEPSAAPAARTPEPSALGTLAQRTADLSVEPAKLAARMPEQSAGRGRLAPRASEQSAGPGRLGPRSSEQSAEPGRLSPRASEQSAEPETVVERPADPGATDEPGQLDEPGRLAARPLGQAPLLDSAPLPATRPGMLRPRPSGNVGRPAPGADGFHRADESDGFSLPTQRPAFDVGSDEPADIA